MVPLAMKYISWKFYHYTTRINFGANSGSSSHDFFGQNTYRGIAEHGQVLCVENGNSSEIRITITSACTVR